MELAKLLDNVNDPKSFLIFANALLDDREPQEDRVINDIGFCGDWANNDISGFLEGAIAWAEDSNFDTESENPWSKFAIFLYAGKTYE